MDVLRLLLQNYSPKVTPEGMSEAGNVRIDQRPSVPNPEGGESTVLSMGIGEGDPSNPVEVVIPRVVNGQILTPDEAVEHYVATGEHLGKFGPAKERPLGPLAPPQRQQASDYGRILHEDQEAHRFAPYVTPSAQPTLANILLSKYR